MHMTRNTVGRLAVMLVAAALALPPAAAGMPARAALNGQSARAANDELPPVPKEAQDAYLRAYDIIGMLNQRADKAAGSPEWETVIKRLMEAQAIASTAPRILRDLGLAQEYRGRSSAAVAWFEAARCAIAETNPGSSQLEEIGKRIERLKQAPENLIEVALDFAKGEIPFLHAKRLPAIEVPDIWPSRPMPPVGPMMVQQANGQWVRNPDLFMKDGTAKEIDLEPEQLEKFLIGLRLSIGDPSAITEAEEFWKKHWNDHLGGGSNESLEYVEVSQVHVGAAKACIQAFVAAKAWRDVENLADEAAAWCDRSHFLPSSEGAQAFRQLKQQAVENIGQESEDKLSQWLELAAELSRSDDEIYFQASIDGLRQMTEKGDVVLAKIARAVQPIGRNLLRLRSIAD